MMLHATMNSSTNLLTPKSRMIMMTKQKSFSHLPDIVSDCEEKLHQISDDENLRITCKQIAHSLRLVADQMDRKYCQDVEFNRNLNYLSLRLVFQSLFCTLWTRSLLPYILLFCKTKLFFY